MSIILLIQFIKYLPNIFTIARIVLVPFLMFCFYINNKSHILSAFCIFNVACIFDFLDGLIARSLNQSSKFGAWLDPIADKILISITVLLMTWRNFFSLMDMVCVSIIMCREILVAEIRAKNSINVSKLAQWKTFTQMISLCGFLLYQYLLYDYEYPLLFDAIAVFSRCLLLIASILSVVTIYCYFKESRDD